MMQNSPRISITRVLCFVCVIAAASGSSASIIDHEAPVVESVYPSPNQIDVIPRSPIEVFLKDEDVFPEVSGSGIDLQSIELFVLGESVAIFADPIGDNRVFVHSNSPKPMPSWSTIKAEISAFDNAGNRMPPFVWYFFTSGMPDTQPPEITGMSPPNGSGNVPPRVLVYCKILDYESGVDPSSIIVNVNQSQVIFDIKPVTSGYFISYEPVNQFPFNSMIWINVSASDLDNNKINSSWWFRIMPEPIEPPDLIAPQNDDLLNFQIENGVMTFKWVYNPSFQDYRLFLNISGYSGFEEIDLSSEDYELIAGGIAQKTYPLAHDEWKHIAELGKIRWFIQMLDGPGGNPVCIDSETHFFFLANPDVVVLRSPVNNSQIYNSSGSPLFRWDSFDNAVHYTFGMAIMGQDGEIIEDYFVRTIGSGQTSFRFSQSLWDQLPNGIYVWTVEAKLSNGSKSDFVNYTFRRNTFPLIQQAIKTTN